MLRELIGLREEGARLAERLAASRHRAMTGLEPRESLRDALAAHRRVTSAEALAEAREALAKAEAEDPKRPGRVSRLSSLRDFLAQVHALSLEPGAAQELFELPRRAVVRPPGDAGLQGALPPVVVARELPFVRAREHRAALEDALARAVAPLEGARSACFEAAQAALAGDPLAPHARGWTGPDPREVCERLLSDTDAIVKDLGGWLLERRLGVRPGEAERHDVLHLVHAPRCAGAFPAGELLRTVRRWAGLLRFDAHADGAVKLDDDDRPLKAPGAHALPLDPPYDVRVSLLPQEGPRPLSALLSALSVAQLRTGPPGDAPPEDLWFGDPAVEAACGAVLSWLVAEEGFLSRCAKADLRRDDVREIAFGFVLDARLAAARTLASLLAHESGPSARAGHVARDLFARATGAVLPRGLAFAELDPFLGDWATLRGLALAARLRALFVERFDDDWFRNPRSLSALHALWSRGGRPTAAELWAEAGGEMSISPLVRDLTRLCG